MLEQKEYIINYKLYTSLGEGPRIKNKEIKSLFTLHLFVFSEFIIKSIITSEIKKE